MNNVSISWYDVDECPWGETVEPFVQSVLQKREYHNWDVAVVFCTDAFMQTLNKHYRQIDAPTDILSFEQADEYYEGTEVRFNAGDMIISLDSLKQNAQTFCVSVNEELKRLLIHGVLHLGGMDHSDNNPEQPMLQLQEQILGSYHDTVIYWE